MVYAFLFGGPADGTLVDLTEAGTTLDIIMDDCPYVTHEYIVFSTNNIGDEENQIFKYGGIKDDDEVDDDDDD